MLPVNSKRKSSIVPSAIKINIVRFLALLTCSQAVHSQATVDDKADTILSKPSKMTSVITGLSPISLPPSIAAVTRELFSELLAYNYPMPSFDNSEDIPSWHFKPSYHRRFRLPASTNDKIVSDLMSKNFTLYMVLRQDSQNFGTLISVISSFARYFEIFSNAKQKELRIWLSVRDGLRTWTVPCDLANGYFHEILFEVFRERVTLTIDCAQQFSLIVDGVLQAVIPPARAAGGNLHSFTEVWFGQRNQFHSSAFIGEFRTAIVSKGQFLRHAKCKDYFERRARELTTTTPLPTLAPYRSRTSFKQKPIIKSQDSVSSIKKLQTFKPAPASKPMSDAVPQRVDDDEDDENAGERKIEKMITCYECERRLVKLEFLEHKIEYLDTEFKKLREIVLKYESQLKKVQLYQRGCRTALKEWVREGETIPSKTDSCIECTCFESKLICHPVGCPPLQCKHPQLEPGQCCPVCKQPCQHNGKLHEHGVSITPKHCVRCTCNDGEMHCLYENVLTCPVAQCEKERMIVLAHHCCATCMRDEYCTTLPCPANAVCTERKYGRDCVCKNGYIAGYAATTDQEMQCFDIDECKWGIEEGAPRKACGNGTRCVNLPGSFMCDCLPGYVKIDDQTCVDILLY